MKQAISILKPLVNPFQVTKKRLPKKQNNSDRISFEQASHNPIINCIIKNSKQLWVANHIIYADYIWLLVDYRNYSVKLRLIHTFLWPRVFRLCCEFSWQN